MVEKLETCRFIAQMLLHLKHLRQQKHIQQNNIVEIDLFCFCTDIRSNKETTPKFILVKFLDFQFFSCCICFRDPIFTVQVVGVLSDLHVKFEPPSFYSFDLCHKSLQTDRHTDRHTDDRQYPFYELRPFGHLS